MKINWKEVAVSAGYKSMKAAIAVEANRKWSTDGRYEEQFIFAINRAKQHIYVKAWLDDQDYTDYLIDRLNVWELNRKQSFLSYYTDYNIPKKSSRVLKTRSIRNRIKYYKTDPWYKNSNRAAVELSTYLQKIRTKKARWTNKRKADAKHWRDRGL